MLKIIDELTGRILEGRRFGDGLHQALEAKEKIDIQAENQTLASITYQNYFKLYSKISGCTGTAATEAEEFFEIYNLPVVVIPTNKKMIRNDFNDQIFRSEDEKNNAIIKKINLKEVMKSEGVVAVITSDDIPGRNDVGPVYDGDPIFPKTKIEYFGQPLFAVAAISTELARKAVLKAKVTYEELKPIVTINDALKNNSLLFEPRIIKKGDPQNKIIKLL